MHRIMTTLVLSAALIGTAAWANEDSNTDTNQQPGSVATDSYSQPSDEQPGTADETAGTTTTTAEEATRGYLSDEVVGVRPQVGFLLFKDNLGTDSTQARAAYGLTLGMNAMPLISKDLKQFYAGPETGLIYSHLGSASSNFFGANAPASVAAGSNFFYIPANLKVGYNIADRWRVAVHGGGNITYRSISDSMFLGDSTVGTTSNWRIYPNVGADFEASFGKNLALTLRPDLTVTPGNEIFTGTVALAIPIG